VVIEGTQLVHIVLSINLDIDYLKKTRSEEDWAGVPLYSTHIVCQVANGKSFSCCRNYSDTINRKLLTVEAVAFRDPRGDQQFFSPKYLLQTAAGIMFLEGTIDVLQPICPSYKYSKPILCDTYFTHQQYSFAVAIL
jgi:hypothetical protein